MLLRRHALPLSFRIGVPKVILTIARDAHEFFETALLLAPLALVLSPFGGTTHVHHVLAFVSDLIGPRQMGVLVAEALGEGH